MEDSARGVLSWSGPYGSHFYSQDGRLGEARVLLARSFYWPVSKEHGYHKQTPNRCGRIWMGTFPGKFYNSAKKTKYHSNWRTLKRFLRRQLYFRAGLEISLEIDISLDFSTFQIANSKHPCVELSLRPWRLHCILWSFPFSMCSEVSKSLWYLIRTFSVYAFIFCFSLQLSYLISLQDLFNEAVKDIEFT